MRVIDPAYPPLNYPKAIADDVWVVDSEPLRALNVLTLPLRMTVFRLETGDLLLYSPTSYSDTLRVALERLGPIRHIVTPSVAHWMFARSWQVNCPSAELWGPRELAQRSVVQQAGLRFDGLIGRAAPPAWRDQIEQIAFSGPGYRELAFFHKRSKTLVVTDIVVNVEESKLPLGSRLLAEIAGICAPEGRAPLHLRALLLLNRRANAVAAARLVSLAPARLIVCHGTIVDRAVKRFLATSLGWLGAGSRQAGRAPGRRAEPRHPAPVSTPAIGLAVALGLTAVALNQTRGRARKRRW